VFALTWDGDGKRVLVVGSDDLIRSVDVTSGAVSPIRKLVPRNALVRVGIIGGGLPKRFVWSPGGKMLANIESVGGDVKTWDAVTGKEGDSVRVGGNPRPMGLTITACAPAWDRNGQRIAMGHNDGVVEAWRVGARKAVRGPVYDSRAWS